MDTPTFDLPDYLQDSINTLNKQKEEAESKIGQLTNRLNYIQGMLEAFSLIRDKTNKLIKPTKD